MCEPKSIFWVDKDGQREYIYSTPSEYDIAWQSRVAMIRSNRNMNLYYKSQKVKCRNHNDGTIELYPAIPDKRYMVYRKKGCCQ